MKLTDILKEIELEKGKWAPIPRTEIPEYEKILLDLINIAYKPVGGNPNFKTPSDVENPKNDFEVIDVDADDEIDAASVTKKTNAGTKLVATAHDGTSAAKKAIIMHKVDLLNQSGYFAEVSGRVKDILINQGIPIITDQSIVEKVLSGKSIVWHGDGTYDREIGGDMYTKTMVGHPLVH